MQWMCAPRCVHLVCGSNHSPKVPERGEIIDSRGAMRKFAFVLLSFCLPSVVTVVDAAPSSVRACRCGDSGQRVNAPMRHGPRRSAQAHHRPVIARSATNQEAQAPRNEYGGGEIVQHPAGCPARLFCGCGASIEAFGHPVPDLWLVSSWYRFPRAAPAPGMAVLWGTHHVAIIRQYYGDGTALLYDANSGRGLTRVHRTNIASLVVVDPHAALASPTPSSLMVIL